MERGGGCTAGCGSGRGQRDPVGGTLTSHVAPGWHGDRPPCSVRGYQPVAEVPMERLPCHSETLTTCAKRLQGMSGIAEPPLEIPDTDELPDEALPVLPSTVPSPETGKDPSGIKLPPWLGKWGTRPEKESTTTVPGLPPTPPTPAEKPSQSVPQRSCVSCNWQKETLADPLDSLKNLGCEDFQRGYHGLPIHQFLSSLTDSSAPKYCPPTRVLLLGQGEAEPPKPRAPRKGSRGVLAVRQRKVTLASMLYEKYSKETEEEIHPHPRHMESVSTTHQDFCAMGFQSTPQPITQPHNYLTEQPTSFWLELARGRPGVTSLFGRNILFKKNAAFSTPITMYLGHPEPFNLSDPYDPLSSQLQPHKQ